MGVVDHDSCDEVHGHFPEEHVDNEDPRGNCQDSPQAIDLGT